MPHCVQHVDTLRNKQQQQKIKRKILFDRYHFTSLCYKADFSFSAGQDLQKSNSRGGESVCLLVFNKKVKGILLNLYKSEQQRAKLAACSPLSELYTILI